MLTKSVTFEFSAQFMLALFDFLKTTPMQTECDLKNMILRFFSKKMLHMWQLSEKGIVRNLRQFEVSFTEALLIFQKKNNKK